jgi:hypothetical protein
MMGCYIAKGKQNHFKHVIYLVGWIDLLGYGSMLRDCKFDSSSGLAKDAVNRLEIFNNTLKSESHRQLPVLQINDGAVLWRELSFRTKSVTIDFLKRSIHLFESVNKNDIAAGFFGARMVLAVGTYMRMSSSKYQSETNQNATNLIKAVNSGLITAEEAIHKACHYSPSFSAIPCLQANFAFSKAYIAESQGKSAGFEGNHLFIDASIFTDIIPSWLLHDRIIHWDYPGLTSDFIQYKGLDLDQLNGSDGAGVLYTSQIAAKIITDYQNKNTLFRRFRK